MSKTAMSQTCQKWHLHDLHARGVLAELLTVSWLILCGAVCFQLPKGHPETHFGPGLGASSVRHTGVFRYIPPQRAVEDAFLFLAEQAMIAKVCEELQNMAVHHIYLPFFFLFKKKISVFWVTAHVVTQQEPLPCVELKYGQLPAPEKPAASISSCKSLEIM